MASHLVRSFTHFFVTLALVAAATFDAGKHRNCFFLPQ